MTYEPRWGAYQGSHLPHREADGRPQMITIRLADSLPREVFAEKLELATTDDERRLLRQRYLDQGRGRCVLNRPCIAEMVGDALEFYDGSRYRLVEWVVMPNHVHFVYRNPQAAMGTIMKDLKSYTSHRINDILDDSGQNWQIDFFDRFARNRKHLYNMCCYTLLNPVHAGLVDDPFDWPYSSLHRYSPAFKDRLRAWYRSWKNRFWQSIAK